MPFSLTLTVRRCELSPVNQRGDVPGGRRLNRWRKPNEARARRLHSRSRRACNHERSQRGVLPEQKCQARRANAAGKYAECAQKALGKLSLSGDLNAYNAAGGKCVTKYDATWDRLQGEATGSGATCDNPRFVDNGDGTVTDRLTALQWEKKDNLDNSPNPADPHDADNSYTWSAPSGTAADGTAFMSFLASLNSGGFSPGSATGASRRETSCGPSCRCRSRRARPRRASI